MASVATMASNSEPKSVLCGSSCRLGKQSRGRPRPIIGRFICRSDRDKVWKLRCNLKDSQIKIGEDLPNRLQDISKKIFVPAMKKVINPRNKASVIGDKPIVNDKHNIQYESPKRWLSTDSSNNS